jgi:sodium/hydrogen antiporter
VDPVDLLVVVGVLLAYALISRRLSASIVSAAMFFLAGGLLAGPSGFDLLGLPATSTTVEVLAELTLALVLFADASRIRVAALRRQASLPVRLLGLGLPLTIVAGAVGAMVVLPELLLAEAVVLAVILAPTDAALGQAVVSDGRLPSRVRQALNVESGLNDGICVPLLVIALAWADTESEALTAQESLRVATESIGFGLLAGVVVGGLVAVALRASVKAQWAGGSWEQVIPVAAALASYALADWWGGSGFIAAFVGGLVFGRLFREHEEAGRLLEEAGGVTNAVTFIVLGAVVVFPILDGVDLRVAMYAVMSLTVIRMGPVALALLGTGARLPTTAFIGWFGPRGLATLVFAVLVLDTEGLPHGDVVVTTALLTVLLSVLAHGMTAVPLVSRYSAWYQSHGTKPPMESIDVHVPRWRGQLHEREAAGRPPGRP